MPQVVAVIGSREFPHPQWIDNAIRRMTNTQIIVSGGARGVDTFAEDAAKKYGKRFKEFPVEDWEWELLGKGIANVRNMVLVMYTSRVKGHVLIFAVIENGRFVPTKGSKGSGSGRAYNLCKELGIGHTVIDQKGNVVWTTHANFAAKT